MQALGQFIDICWGPFSRCRPYLVCKLGLSPAPCHSTVKLMYSIWWRRGFSGSKSENLFSCSPIAANCTVECWGLSYCLISLSFSYVSGTPTAACPGGNIGGVFFPACPLLCCCSKCWTVKTVMGASSLTKYTPIWGNDGSPSYWPCRAFGGGNERVLTLIAIWEEFT